MQEQSFDRATITSKLNDLSTIADQSSFHTIGPIHSFSETYLSPLQYRRSPPKPAFGTSSIRQIKELKGNKVTDIVAYSRINYEKNQKYQDRYEEIQPKLTPFLATSPRFSDNKKRNPGPGAYKFPQIFRNDPQLKKNQNAMFCPFKRWQVKQRKHTGKSYIAEKDFIFSHEKQNLQKIDKNLQQRIKQKREEMKLKMQKLKQLMKKPQSQIKPDLKRMGYSLDAKNDTQARFEENRYKIEAHQKQYCIQTDLKEITSKYMPKNEYNFERNQFRTGSEIKNFQQKYNHQPVFLQKTENLFSSYLNKSETPGPGYYEKRTKKLPKSNLAGCQKIFL